MVFTVRLPENVPVVGMPNGIIQFVVLCPLIFGLMAFANFMQERERTRRDD
jgi:hypothetical protein